METALLTRLESSDQGTFGVLYAKGKAWKTGELPWKENAPNVSCIPPGRYACKWTWSGHFHRRLYEVCAVPGRAGIRIHSANLMGSTSSGLRAQLNGCISLGLRLGYLDGQKALLLSTPAIRQFETAMRNEPFGLVIT